MICIRVSHLLLGAHRFIMTAVFAACVAVSADISSSVAATIINDTWLDGDRTDPAPPIYAENSGIFGADTDLDGNLESAWFINNNGGSNSTTVGHMVTNPPTGSMNWYTYFTPEATPVNLINNGDRLRVTWQFTPGGVNSNGNTSQDFRLALARTPVGGRTAVDGVAPPNAAYTGYALFTNMGNTLGNSNPFQLRERSAGSNPLLNNSGDWSALANGATTGNHGYDSGTEYTLVWTITRNGAGLDVNATMSGGTLNNSGTASVSFFDPNGNGFSFDTFGVRPSSSTNTATSFDTILFRVEFIPIPEPTCLVLLTIGCAGFALTRRPRT